MDRPIGSTTPDSDSACSSTISSNLQRYGIDATLAILTFAQHQLCENVAASCSQTFTFDVARYPVATGPIGNPLQVNHVGVQHGHAVHLR